MATKKKTAKKKTAKKKSGSPLPPNGLWFDRDFTEGPGSDPIGKKRKLIEAFYRGYLHSCNENDGSLNQFKILDDPDGFIWSVRRGKQHVEVYITPPPIASAPGAGISDPPNPTSPPPQMT